MYFFLRSGMMLLVRKLVDSLPLLLLLRSWVAVMEVESLT
jgi:hypothetical protein